MSAALTRGSRNRQTRPPEPSAGPDRVCAVVVTFNRKALLRPCLDAVLAQRRPADAVLVVDNASTDGTEELFDGDYQGISILRLATNTGGAGGFAAGLQWALLRGFDWVWLMDDDVSADRDCLAALLDVTAESGKRVAIPRRLDVDGTDCMNEAVLVERDQRFERVRIDPSRERYRLVDLFTFEGPLIHRSVIDAVGLPDPRLFIRGDDLLFAIRINRRCGPLSCALAAQAIMQRRLPPEPHVVARSRVKRWMTGDARYAVLPDLDHWKTVYSLRNRHLICRELAWRRRRARHVVADLGYICADVLVAVRHRWDWWLRFKWNVRAWGLGMVGNRTSFLDPIAYRARIMAGRGARLGGVK